MPAVHGLQKSTSSAERPIPSARRGRSRHPPDEEMQVHSTRSCLDGGAPNAERDERGCFSFSMTDCFVSRGSIASGAKARLWWRVLFHGLKAPTAALRPGNGFFRHAAARHWCALGLKGGGGSQSGPRSARSLHRGNAGPRSARPLARTRFRAGYSARSLHRGNCGPVRARPGCRDSLRARLCSRAPIQKAEIGGAWSVQEFYLRAPACDLFRPLRRPIPPRGELWWCRLLVSLRGSFGCAPGGVAHRWMDSSRRFAQDDGCFLFRESCGEAGKRHRG